MVRKFESRSLQKIEGRSVDAVNPNTLKPKSEDLIRKEWMSSLRTKLASWGLAVSLLATSVYSVPTYAKTTTSEKSASGKHKKVLRFNVSEYERTLKEAEETRMRFNTLLTKEDIDILNKLPPRTYSLSSVSEISAYVEYETQNFPNDTRHRTIRQVYKKWLLLLKKISDLILQAEEGISNLKPDDPRYKRLADLIQRGRNVLSTVGKDPLTKGLTFWSSEKDVRVKSKASDEEPSKSSAKPVDKSEKKASKPKHKAVKKKRKSKDHHKTSRNVKEIREFEENCDTVEKALKKVDSKVDQLRKVHGDDPYLKEAKRKLSRLSGDLADLRRRGVNVLRISRDPEVTLKKLQKKLGDLYAQIANVNSELENRYSAPTKAVSKPSKVDTSNVDRSVEEAKRVADSLDLGAVTNSTRTTDSTEVSNTSEVSNSGESTTVDSTTVLTPTSEVVKDDLSGFNVDSDSSLFYFGGDNSSVSMARLGLLLVAGNWAIELGLIGSEAKYHVSTDGDELRAFSVVNGLSHEFFGDLVDNSKPGTVLYFQSVPYMSLSFKHDDVTYSGRWGIDGHGAIYGGATISSDLWVLSGDLISTKVPGLSGRLMNGRVGAKLDSEYLKGSIEYLWFDMPPIPSESGLYEIPVLSALNADLVIPFKDTLYVRVLNHAMWHNDYYRTMVAAGLGVVSDGMFRMDVGPYVVLTSDDKSLGFYTNLALRHELNELSLFVAFGLEGAEAFGLQATLPIN